MRTGTKKNRVFLLRFLLASSRCASLVLQLFPLSQLYSILLLTLLLVKDEEDRKADGNESLTVIFFLIDWFHFFGGLLIRERSFWEALEGYFQRVGNPRKLKRSQDPWFVKVHTHIHSLCVLRRNYLFLSTPFLEAIFFWTRPNNEVSQCPLLKE